MTDTRRDIQERGDGWPGPDRHLGLDLIRLTGVWAWDEEERRRGLEAGCDLDRVFDVAELVRGDDVFFMATGITDGDLLHGVGFARRQVITESLVMHAHSGMARFVRSEHTNDWLAAGGSVDEHHHELTGGGTEGDRR